MTENTFKRIVDRFQHIEQTHVIIKIEFYTYDEDFDEYDNIATLEFNLSAVHDYKINNIDAFTHLCNIKERYDEEKDRIYLNANVYCKLVTL